MSGAASGLFGAHGGDWFAAPGWVDVRKPAGTSLQRLSSWSAWAQSVATFKHMLFSVRICCPGHSAGAHSTAHECSPSILACSPT